MKLKGENWGLEEVMGLTVADALKIFCDEKRKMTSHEKRLFDDICEKLKLAVEMGLDHLSLLRKAKSLSAGEYQRLLLIKYLSFQGTDSLFILDEPSLGLAENEMRKLLTGLRQIIAQGNTVILIDHSELVQKESDHLIVIARAQVRQEERLPTKVSQLVTSRLKRMLIGILRKLLLRSPSI